MSVDKNKNQKKSDLDELKEQSIKEMQELKNSSESEMSQIKTKSKNETVKPRSKSKDETAKSKDEPAKSKDETAKSKDETAKSKDETAKTKDETAKSKADSANSKSTKGDTVKSKTDEAVEFDDVEVVELEEETATASSKSGANQSKTASKADATQSKQSKSAQKAEDKQKADATQKTEDKQEADLEQRADEHSATKKSSKKDKAVSQSAVQKDDAVQPAEEAGATSGQSRIGKSGKVALLKGKNRKKASAEAAAVSGETIDLDDDDEPTRGVDRLAVKKSQKTLDKSNLTSRNVTLDKETLDSTSLKNLKKMRLKKPVNLSGAERIHADVKQGLTSEQVYGQLEKGYVNMSTRRTGKTYVGIILSNTFTFFNILAFIVAIAMLFTSPTFTQMFFIFIIFANIIIGIIQEIKAKLSVDKLHIITAPSATIIRGGQVKNIPLDEVVLDDIIYTDMGKQIPADSIILSGECEVNESMITGESLPVKKVKGDMMLAGSFISSGHVYARVERVGDANYAQTLTSNAKKYQKPKSELNNSIRLIMKIATIFIIPITLAMILIYLFPNKGEDVKDTIRSISGAVIGMIPAGMFLLTTVALASSVLRLANKKTLVKDLYCIEMLARVDTLCLDKTGTITDGSMTVQKIIHFKNDESSVSPEVVIGSMLSATEDNNQTALALAAKFGYNNELKPKTIIPFSSQRKYSMVQFDGVGTYILGAPEYVLKDMGVRMEKLVDESTSAGFRVMMLVFSPQPPDGDKLPAIRKAVSMIVIEDCIRDDAIETIKWFKENDVSVKVISGDNPATVSEIAKRVGIEQAELYISLDGLSDQEIIEASSKYTVFGRVTPEQKALLVRSIKAKGHTVAMTGDGVNDILAMREADCAIAIASGAEAARNVSHLVLVDNNFTAMPYIVLEGRKVVNNIQKSSALFLMKTIMSIFLALIFVVRTKPYPITTDNLLLLELFIIGVSSFFLALQPNTNRIRGKFLFNVIGRAVPGGLALILAVVSVDVFAFFMGDAITPDMRTTMIVVCLTFTGLIVLCKVCEPFNFYRAFLVIVSTIAVSIAITITGTSFGIRPFDSGNNYIDLTCILFIISQVLLSYFVITLISKLLKRGSIIFD